MLKTYVYACVVAAPLALAACYSTMPNGQPYNGIDPISGQHASLKAIEKCSALGGIKTYNVVDDRAVCVR